MYLERCDLECEHRTNAAAAPSAWVILPPVAVSV